ncbi:hypothetical protein F1880_001537 [Penicillium rolfsii]|nr:hypothetical protein F1880_001537 [Penicillium rolfsii]
MSPASMATFWVRSTVSDIESVPSTFSSWDKCMAKSYCKWPVIAAIIIASVIIIGIIGCIINCLCCGYQCCKCCCGCCCPSGRRRNKQPKYYDQPTPYKHQPPPPPPPNQPNPHTAYQPSPAPPVYRGAVQTATFDNPKSSPANIDEDALPHMPTWAAAVAKHVEDHSHRDEVEMEPLNPQHHPDRNQGASPLHVATSSDYPPDRMGPAAGGYRGFAPNPYARRSPGPATGYGTAQDPYARRSPGLMSPVGAPSPYDQPQHNYSQHGAGYDHRQQQQPYDEYHDGAGYHAITSPSPVATSTYQQSHNTYNAMPAAYSPPREHPPALVTGGFQRQPSFGSSQYPPTYTSHPASPPPPFQSTAGSEYGAHEYGVAETGSGRDQRPPSLLQSGRRPVPGTFRNV